MLLANYFSESDDPHDINAPGVTNGIASSRWLFDTFLGVSSSDLLPDEWRAIQPWLYTEIVARDPSPRWMKVHDARQRLQDRRFLFPREASGTVIYIIRNPLDVAVSNAFHDGHGDMARAVAKLCDPATTLSKPSSTQLPQFLGSWSAHVASWVDQTDIPVLVVRYEDMLADTGRELERVIRAARPDVVIEPRQIARAIDYARFEKLAAAEQAHGFHEAPRKAERFFRKGQAGDWRVHLSAAQVDQIYAHHLAMMTRFGYATDQIDRDSY